LRSYYKTYLFECRRSLKLNRPRWWEVWWASLRSKPSNFESQEELIGRLKDEIAVLKGEKKRRGEETPAIQSQREGERGWG
jgi:hypothetical protein